MTDLFSIILAFLRSDIFIPFGLLTIPFLIGRQIPKLKGMTLKFDEMACRLIVFSGILYTIVLVGSYGYIFLCVEKNLHEEYTFLNRASGPYVWAYWLMVFWWLFITQPFRFKLVRKNIFIRLLSVPFFLMTLEQYVIFSTSLHRDYGSDRSLDFHLLDILDTIPYWQLHLLLKLALFMVYVFLFQWMYKKLKTNKVVS